MTKREALLYMLEMWDYIYLNKVSKYTAILKLDMPEFENHCPLCEYVFQKFGRTPGSGAGLFAKGV